jgi:acyl carrier protein
MSSSDILLPEVQEIFRDVLDEPDLVLTRQSNAESVPEWDSLAHINLITAIERQYKVKFALGELQEMKHMGDLLDLLARKIAAK